MSAGEGPHSIAPRCDAWEGGMCKGAESTDSMTNPVQLLIEFRADPTLIDVTAHLESDSVCRVKATQHTRWQGTLEFGHISTYIERSRLHIFRMTMRCLLLVNQCSSLHYQSRSHKRNKRPWDYKLTTSFLVSVGLRPECFLFDSDCSIY